MSMIESLSSPKILKKHSLENELPPKITEIKKSIFLAVKDTEDEVIDSSDKGRTEYLQRLEKETLFEHFFKYGRLPESHPAQVYLDTLSKKLQESYQGKNFKIYLLPDYPSENAMAFPSGTILISTKIFASITSVDALVGLIGHEFTHVAREHVIKSMDNLNGNILSDLSQKRHAELEADMLGTFDFMEVTGYNPLGMKQFFTSLAEKEKKPGLTHGSSSGRALNIETIFHLKDVKTINKPIEPLPEEFVEALQDPTGKYSYTELRRNFSYLLTIKNKPLFLEKKKSQQLLLESLSSVDDLMCGIKSVPEYIEKKNPLEKIAVLFAPFFPQTSAGKFALRMCMDFFLMKTEEPENDELQTCAELLDAAHCIDAACMNLPVEFQLGSYKYILYSLHHKIAKIAASSDEKKQIVHAWGNALHALNERFGSEKMNVEDIVNAMEKYSTDSLELEENDDDSVSEKAKVNTALYKEAYNRFKCTCDTITTEEIEGYVQRYILLNKQKLNKCTKEQLLLVLSGISEGLQVIDHAKFGNGHFFKQRYEVHDERKMLLFLRIFEEFYSRFQVLSSQSEGDILLQKVAVYVRHEHHIEELLENGIGRFWGYTQDQIKKNLKEEEESPYEQQIVSFEQFSKVDYSALCHRVLQVNRTLDVHLATLEKKEGEIFLKQLYKLIVDKEFYNKEIGIVIPDYAEKGIEVRENFFMQPFIEYLIAKKYSLQEILVFLDEMVKEDIKIDRFLERKRKMMAPIINEKVLDFLRSKELPEASIEELTRVTSWIDAPYLRSGVQEYIKKIKWPTLSYEEKLELISMDKKNGLRGKGETATEVIEKDMVTREQYHMTLERFRTTNEHVGREGSEHMGIAIFFNHTKLFSNQANNFIEALLSSTEDPIKLYEFCYHMVTEVRDMVHGEISEKEFHERLLSAEEMMNALYSMGDIEKRFLLRKLLVEREGIFMVPEKKEQFLNFIFTQWLVPSEDEKELYDLLIQIKDILIKHEDWETLYLAFEQILTKKMAIPPFPDKNVRWDLVYDVERDFYDAYFSTCENLSFKEWSLLLKNTIEKVVPKQVTENMKANIWGNLDEINLYNHGKILEFLREKGMAESASSAHITPISFIKDVASRMGAFGTRFLQLLPLFVDLPEKYREGFKDVYDSMKGQSKLNAMYLMEREDKNFWDTISTVDESIGGGSIITAYKIKQKDGDDGVIKIVNPNIVYHIDKMRAFTQGIVDELAKNDPRPSYEIASALIDDIREWLVKESDLSSFHELDHRYSEKHEGYHLKNSSYSIYIPGVFGPENKYFTMENFVEGDNLTRWEKLTEDGHDMKEIIALLVSQTIRELQDGIVHSDIHPGNFRVTPDHKLAVLDRTFKLQLTPVETDLMGVLFQPFVSNERKVQLLTDYFLSHSTREGIEEEVAGIVTDVLSAISEQQWNYLSTALMKLKHAGVALPLNFTLLVKNFLGLEKMVEKAGFKNILEAYFYGQMR